MLMGARWQIPFPSDNDDVLLGWRQRVNPLVFVHAAAPRRRRRVCVSRVDDETRFRAARFDEFWRTFHHSLTCDKIPDESRAFHFGLEFELRFLHFFFSSRTSLTAVVCNITGVEFFADDKYSTLAWRQFGGKVDGGTG